MAGNIKTMIIKTTDGKPCTVQMQSFGPFGLGAMHDMLRRLLPTLPEFESKEVSDPITELAKELSTAEAAAEE